MFDQKICLMYRNYPLLQYMSHMVWPILSWPDHARLIGAISARISVDRMDSGKSVISS